MATLATDPTAYETCGQVNHPRYHAIYGCDAAWPPGEPRPAAPLDAIAARWRRTQRTRHILGLPGLRAAPPELDEFHRAQHVRDELDELDDPAQDAAIDRIDQRLGRLWARLESVGIDLATLYADSRRTVPEHPAELVVTGYLAALGAAALHAAPSPPVTFADLEPADRCCSACEPTVPGDTARDTQAVTAAPLGGRP